MREKTQLGIYAATVLAFFVLIGNVVRCIPDAVEDVSRYPDMTYEQIISEHKTLVEEVKKPFLSYEEYFGVVDKLLVLELACKKFERMHESIDPRYPSAPRVVLGSINFLRTENEGRAHKLIFSSGDWKERADRAKEFKEANEKRDRTYSNLVLFRERDPELDRRFFRSLFIFQLGLVPFMFAVYMIRIRDEGGSIAFEMMSNPLFPFYLFVWQVGLFKYRAAGLKVQIRRMVRYASLTLSAVLSFGAATVKAQTKEKEDSGQNDRSHTLVVSGSTQYLSKYLGLNGAVFHPESVLQSSLTLAHKGGLYANFWKSVALTGLKANPNFGREEDYTLGYSRGFSKRNLNTSVTYFNVTPLSVLRKGDLVQASVMVSNPIASLPFSNYLWVRGILPLKNGSPPGGWFVHFGASREVKVVGKISAAINAEAVSDSGAFGFKRAGIFRASVVLRVPVGKLFLELPLRMSVPLTRPGDGRKFEHVLGVGCSFSH